MGSRFDRSLSSLNREDSDKYTLTITLTSPKYQENMTETMHHLHILVKFLSIVTVECQAGGDDSRCGTSPFTVSQCAVDQETLLACPWMCEVCPCKYVDSSS